MSPINTPSLSKRVLFTSTGSSTKNKYGILYQYHVFCTILPSSFGATYWVDPSSSLKLKLQGVPDLGFESAKVSKPAHTVVDQLQLRGDKEPREMVGLQGTRGERLRARNNKLQAFLH